MGLETTNGIEIRVFGLQRSGNHAIIDWIIEQFRGQTICFLNNVRHGDHDPFESARRSYIYGTDESVDRLRYSHRDVLVYSYEDDRRQMSSCSDFLTSVLDPEFETNRHQYVGLSKRRIDVYVLRDARNFFASRLAKWSELTGVQDPIAVAESWKRMAEACATVQQQDENAEALFCNYRSWKSDKNYRKELSKILGGKFSDASIHKVPSFGGGSSFDKTAYNKSLRIRAAFKKWKLFLVPSTYRRIPEFARRLRGARAMQVDKRWHHFRKDPRFITFWEDEEIRNLDFQLFGK